VCFTFCNANFTLFCGGGLTHPNMGCMIVDMRYPNIEWKLDSDGLPSIPIGGCRNLQTAIAYLEAVGKWTTKENHQVAKVRIGAIKEAIHAMHCREAVRARKEKAKADAACKTRPTEGGIKPPTLTMPPPPKSKDL
jgi:hypothetical protein